MTLNELRKMIGKKRFDEVPYCDKLYIDMDRSKISVGYPASFLDGMRMKASTDNRDYYTFEQLLNDEEAYFISDGYFDIWCPKGMTTQLLIDVGDWDVELSDKITNDLKKFGLINESAA